MASSILAYPLDSGFVSGGEFGSSNEEIRCNLINTYHEHGK